MTDTPPREYAPTVTGIPLLDELIAQRRVIPAANPELPPPTPPRQAADGDRPPSEALAEARDDEGY